MTTATRAFVRRAVANEFLWAAAFLAVLLAIFFDPIVRSHATFSSVANLQQYYYPWLDTAPVPPDPLYPQADQAVYVYPRQVFLTAALDRTGDIPRWNPMTLGGTPFLAESGSRLAYPPMLAVTYLFNPVHAHDVYVIGHLFAAGMAMFALMKELGARFAAALLSGVSWAFASYTMAWIMLEMLAAVVALLPLALLFVYRWHRRDSWSDLGGAALVLGLVLLGSSVELALLGFLVVVGCAAGLAVRRLVARGTDLRPRELVRPLAQLAVLAAGALAVGAAALLPFAALSERSQRGSLPASYQLQLSVPVDAFAAVLTPPAIPHDVAGRVAALNSTQVFVGTAAGCLALVGLARRRPGRILGAALVVLLFLFATGSVVARLTYALVPFLSRLAGTGRTLFLFDLGLAVLGGLGLDAVLRAVDRPRSPRRLAAGLVAVACVVTTSFQLLAYGRWVNPPFQERTAAQLFPPTPVVEAVKDAIGREPGRQRVLVVAPLAGPHILASTTGIALDLPLVNSYEPVVPANVSAIWRVVDGEEPGSAVATPWNKTFQPPFLASTVRTELLARLGVAAVVAPPGNGLGPGWSEPEAARRGLVRTYAGRDGQVFSLADRPPRAVVVDRATRVATAADALARFVSADFDVRREVVLEGGTAGVAESPGPGRPPVPATVEWLRDDPDRIRLSVASPTPGWLVLLDSWDRGWTATVNGRAVSVERANFTQRAVRIPAGTSAVAFSYRPAEVPFGVAATGLGAALLVALAAADEGRRRRRRAPVGPAPGPGVRDPLP